MIITDASETPIDVLYRGFIHAFSDYKVPFRISPQDFIIRLEDKLHIRKDLSVVALDSNEEAKGFIFHTMNSYRRSQTIYNGGTGVLKEYKRKGLALKMYEWCLPNLFSSGADRILLEVITSNEPAINLYRKLGFVYLQTYKCFKARELLVGPYDQQIEVHLEKGWDPKRYRAFKDFEPSFIDSDDQVVYNLKNETILEARSGDILVGFAVFQPRLGRITQLAVDTHWRGKGIGTRLLKEIFQLSEKKELTLLNISEDEEEMINFLEKRGFVNEIDQYEMELSLK